MKQTAELKKKKKKNPTEHYEWHCQQYQESLRKQELKEHGFGFGVTLHNMNGGMLHVIIWNINKIVHTNSPLHFGN